MLVAFLVQNAVWLAPLFLALAFATVIAYILLVSLVRTERCSHCGASNPVEASVCAKCGESTFGMQFDRKGILAALAFLFSAGGMVVAFLSALPHREPPPVELIEAGAGLVLLIVTSVILTWGRSRRVRMKRESIVFAQGFFGGFCGSCGAEILGGKAACPACGEAINTAEPNWTARPKEGEKPSVAVLKIVCTRCKTENPSTARRCGKCAMDLLTYKPVWLRVLYFIVCLLFSGGLGWLAYKALGNPDLFKVLSLLGTGVIALSLTAVALPFYGLYLAFGKENVVDLLEERAARQKSTFPWQSLADLSHGLALADPKKHRGLLGKRVELFKSLELAENATRDELSMTYAMEKNPEGGVGMYIGEQLLSLGGPTNSFQQGFLSGVAKQARKERETMRRAGRVVALGWCPTCKQVVRLDEKLRCEQTAAAGSPRHSGKPKFIQYVVNGDIEEGRQSIPRAMNTAKKRGIRRAWTFAAIFIGLGLVAYLWPLLVK